MKKLHIVLLISVQLGFAQDNYNADLIPSALRNRANATIRNEETVVDMRSRDNVLYSVKQAITVLNKNGDENARLVLFYDKNTAIKSIKGEVFNEYSLSNDGPDGVGGSGAFGYKFLGNDKLLFQS